MDHTYSTTNLTERKRGQHLGAEERGALQTLKKQGYSNRAIARTINCSPSTVGYELHAVHRNTTDAVAKPVILPNVEQQYTRPIAVAAIVCRVYPETPNSSAGW